MQSNQFPRREKPLTAIPRRYRRVKVWKIQSSVGEFCIYAINAQGARDEFKRLSPTAVIVNVMRNS